MAEFVLMVIGFKDSIFFQNQLFLQPIA